MSAFEKHWETVATTAPLLPREHLLHVFPSFGIGGVPLRMVRIINYFDRLFRHTVVALDNDYEAAAGVSSDLDVTILPWEHPKRGALAAIAICALHCAACSPICCSLIIGARSNGRWRAGSGMFHAMSISKQVSVRVRQTDNYGGVFYFGARRWLVVILSSSRPAASSTWRARSGGCRWHASLTFQTASMRRDLLRRFATASPISPVGPGSSSSAP